jgi:hypothetical protein
MMTIELKCLFYSENTYKLIKNNDSLPKNIIIKNNLSDYWRLVWKEHEYIFNSFVY